MNIIVWIVSGLIILSKFLDCWTTSTQITNPNQERNPFARYLFRRFGSQKVIWFTFIVSILLVGFSLWLLFHYYNSLFYKVFYVFIGLVISITQFAVAHTNKTQELNFITRKLLKQYNKH